jgi:hypothetical protein
VEPFTANTGTPSSLITAALALYLDKNPLPTLINLGPTVKGWRISDNQYLVLSIKNELVRILSASITVKAFSIFH